MKILLVIGTRPEAVKMAPLILALRRRAIFQVEVCVTAQHRELLDQVLALFQIVPEYDLNLMAPGQTIHEVTSRVLLGMRAVLEQAQPGLVLVHGDTTTSFAAALAAFYARIPVAHVEAGLRTLQRYQPFPEEMNRRMTDALCTWHYAPTAQARENLLREGVAPDHIAVTGNTVIDALLLARAMPHTFQDPLLAQAGNQRRLLLVTAHRRESFGEPLRQICSAIRTLVNHNAGVEVVYPVHPNPRVLSTVQEELGGVERVHLVAPLDYLPFVHLLARAHIVLTDSGGLQEEAPALGKPVVVMREVTERPEAIEAGTARLAGMTHDGIVAAVQELLTHSSAYNTMASRSNPYGSGDAAERIADHLETLRGKRGPACNTSAS